MVPAEDSLVLERRVRFCGADCTQCDTYQRFLLGDEDGLINSETGYRCCWLPEDYRRQRILGRDCPIKACCERRGILFCGECERIDRCERMKAFYAQPGYDALRARMCETMLKTKEDAEHPGREIDVS